MHVTKNMRVWISATLLTCIAFRYLLPLERAFAHDKRDPLHIDVPARPRLPNTTLPVLNSCSGLADCQSQAADFCNGFNYPNGKILFRDLPAKPRPFPIYSVVCFD